MFLLSKNIKIKVEALYPVFQEPNMHQMDVNIFLPFNILFLIIDIHLPSKKR